MINPILDIHVAIQKLEIRIFLKKTRNLKPEIRNQKSQIAIPEKLKSTIAKSEIKSLFSDLTLAISSSDNHALWQFAVSLFQSVVHVHWN